MSNNKVEIIPIGGPTVIIQMAGFRFLTDPTFDKSGSVYDNGHVVLKKTDDPAMPAERVGRIDAVLLSHDQHKDNLDILGREFLTKVPKTITTVSAASRLQEKCLGLPTWDSTVLENESGHKIKVTATPCRHGPAGIEPIAGDVSGFILEVLDQNHPVVYITGDTVFYEGIAEVSNRYRPDIIIAFAGAARVRGPFDLTMSANDLLDTASAFPQAHIVPVHTDSWEHYTQSKEDLNESFKALGIVERLRIVDPGDSFQFQTPS